MVLNYNHTPLLRFSLPAILAEAGPDDEIIVIDDASTDGAIPALEEWSRRHPALRVVSREKRQGVIPNINLGLETARGEFVYFAGADDFVLPGFAAESLRLLAAHPEAAFSCASFQVVSHDGSRRTLHRVDFEGASYVSPQRLRELAERREDLILPNATVIYRRSALKALGGYDPGLAWHADWFAYTALAFRHGFCFCPAFLAAIRTQETSFSAQGMRDRRAQGKVLREVLLKLGAPAYAAIRDGFREPSILGLDSRARGLFLWQGLRHPGSRWILSWKLARASLRDAWRKPLWNAAWTLLSPLPAFLTPLAKAPLLRLFGASVGRGVRIGAGCRLDRPWKVSIGARARLGRRVVLRARAGIEIGPDASIGAGARLLSESRDELAHPQTLDAAPIRIGSHAQVAAGSALPAGSVIPAARPFC